MSIKLGGSKSKTSSTNTSTSTSTTTPTVPEWASSLTQNVAGRIGDLSRIDPQSLVAGVHPLQQQAASRAGGLDGTPWAYEAAAGALGGAMQQGASTYAPTLGDASGYDPASYGGARLGAATLAGGESLLGNLDAYMSPYRRQVVDSALADYDYGAGQTRAQQDLDLAGSGAFGGSGAALTRSATEDALTRGRATTSANLLDQMFSRGAALSSQDADRRQQAGLANAAAANQFALSQAGYDQQAGLARAEAQNQAGQFNAAARNQMATTNLGAANEAGRFNATAQEQALQRQIEAARGLGDVASAYGANERADIATQAGLGGTLRDIEQQQRQAPITSTQQIVAMLSGLPISLFTGQTTSGTQTGSSTGTTKGSDWSAGLEFTKIPGVSGIPL